MTFQVFISLSFTLLTHNNNNNIHIIELQNNHIDHNIFMRKCWYICHLCFFLSPSSSSFSLSRSLSHFSFSTGQKQSPKVLYEKVVLKIWRNSLENKPKHLRTTASVWCTLWKIKECFFKEKTHIYMCDIEKEKFSNWFQNFQKLIFKKCQPYFVEIKIFQKAAISFVIHNINLSHMGAFTYYVINIRSILDSPLPS